VTFPASLKWPLAPATATLSSLRAVFSAIFAVMAASAATVAATATAISNFLSALIVPEKSFAPSSKIPRRRAFPTIELCPLERYAYQDTFLPLSFWRLKFPQSVVHFLNCEKCTPLVSRLGEKTLRRCDFSCLPLVGPDHAGPFAPR